MNTTLKEHVDSASSAKSANSIEGFRPVSRSYDLLVFDVIIISLLFIMLTVYQLEQILSCINCFLYSAYFPSNVSK